MRILITGAGGFIGANTAEYFSKQGNEVIAFDNLTKYELNRTGYATDATRNYNWNFLKDIGVSRIKGDIRDKVAVHEVSKDVDYIIHTAAQPAMTISIEDPELDFTTNVIGTFNILEAARKYDIPIVNCATIHVYGNKINETITEGETRYLREPPIIDEDYPTVEGDITPLHASKRCADLYVKSYMDTYGLKAASFRLSGLYGPRQFGGEDHGWVANFTIRTLLGIPATVYGTGKQVRDILYASDVAEAFNAFYRRQKPGIYNIGGGIKNSISLIDAIKLIGEITRKETIVNYAVGRKGDLLYFICDISKAKKELGWEPRIPPREGICKLGDWVQSNINLFQSD